MHRRRLHAAKTSLMLVLLRDVLVGSMNEKVEQRAKRNAARSDYEVEQRKGGGGVCAWAAECEDDIAGVALAARRAFLEGRSQR
jgi:hypothetical protein